MVANIETSSMVGHGRANGVRGSSSPSPVTMPTSAVSSSVRFGRDMTINRTSLWSVSGVGVSRRTAIRCPEIRA